MKLEVGKTYLNGGGKECKIIAYDKDATYPYRDDFDSTYYEDGRYYFKSSNRDLVKEVNVIAPSCHDGDKYSVVFGGYIQSDASQVSRDTALNYLKKIEADIGGSKYYSLVKHIPFTVTTEINIKTEE